MIIIKLRIDWKTIIVHLTIVSLIKKAGNANAFDPICIRKYKQSHETVLEG